MTQVPPGPLAGRYELRERLAASPAAEVFLAHDRDLDRSVAVKVLSADLAADPQVVDRFRQAATASATVRDPHVVTVYDWGDDAGTAFVAMEYVDGTNLADTLREARRLAPERAAAIGASVAEGLDGAHRAGIVHGGLTPSDVLLARTGDVKLCDFGTAAAGLAGFASAGAGVAAAQYAAPEQLQGSPADARSDLYALGAILYEAVTGSPPFVANDVVTLTERKLRERPAPPSTHATGVPPALDGIIERLLETDPARRYSSGADVAADLHRLSATLAVPVVAAPAPVVVTTVPEAKTSILPAVPAPEPEKSSKTGWIIGALVVIGLVVAGLVFWAVTQDSNDKKVQVDVPAVVGQPVGAAQAAIRSAGLSPSTVNEPNDQFAANLVFDQSPNAAAKAAKGSVVVLKVSTGATTTTTSSTSTTSTTTTTTTTTTTMPPTTTTTVPPTTTTT